MSQFYASIQGNRGEATRQGSKDSGISGHIRGWNSGCRVICRFNTSTGEDEIYIYATGGSNGRCQDYPLAVIKGRDVQVLPKNDFKL